MNPFFLLRIGDSGVVVTPTATRGGLVSEEVDWKRLQRLRMQQSYIKDDEEVLAIILAELTRRK